MTRTLLLLAALAAASTAQANPILHTYSDTVSGLGQNGHVVSATIHDDFGNPEGGMGWALDCEPVFTFSDFDENGLPYSYEFEPGLTGEWVMASSVGIAPWDHLPDTLVELIALEELHFAVKVSDQFNTSTIASLFIPQITEPIAGFGIRLDDLTVDAIYDDSGFIYNFWFHYHYTAAVFGVPEPSSLLLLVSVITLLPRPYRRAARRWHPGTTQR